MKWIDNLITNYFYVTYKNRACRLLCGAMINSMLTKFNLLISYQNIQTDQLEPHGEETDEEPPEVSYESHEMKFFPRNHLSMIFLFKSC